MAGRKQNADRQNALKLGLRTYEGEPHYKCGTTTRYAAGGSCVHCSRVTATEQREALKYLRAQNALDKLPQPAVPPTELKPDDAAERARHAIDELM